MQEYHTERLPTSSAEVPLNAVIIKQFMCRLMEQNLDVIEEITSLKKTFSASIQEIIATQESLNEDIKLLTFSNAQTRGTMINIIGDVDTTSRSIESTAESILNIKCLLEKVESQQQIITVGMNATGKTNSSQQQSSQPHPIPSENPVPPPRKSCVKCDFRIYSEEHLRKHMKLKHPQKDSSLDF